MIMLTFQHEFLLQIFDFTINAFPDDILLSLPNLSQIQLLLIDEFQYLTYVCNGLFIFYFVRNLCVSVGYETLFYIFY